MGESSVSGKKLGVIKQQSGTMAPLCCLIKYSVLY